jgi:RimJ/RimL family protein N-acetyltransferase
MQFPTKYNCLNQNEFFIEDFKLVPIRYEDRLVIMKWRNEQIYHLRQDKPLTEKIQEDYFIETVARMFNQENPNQILFSYLKNDKCIGYGGLVHINWIDKNAEISFVLNTNLESNEFSFHWSNYLKLLEQVAFNELFLHKIFTYAFDTRPHLYDVLEQNKYKNEAILKEHCYYDETFIDVYIHQKRNPFSLEKLNQTHQKLLFNWVNDYDVRRNSLKTEPVLWKDHLKWFKNELSYTQSKIFIFEKENIQIGQIRINKIDNRWLITYSIDKNQRGKGYGFLICNALVKRFNSFKFKAVVKHSNIPSKKVFEKLGFCKKNDQKGNLITYLFN